MNDPSSVVLASAERVETAARDLYVGLAAVVDHPPELRKLFRRLAAEEALHALHLRVQAGLEHRRAWTPREAEALVARLERMAGAVREQAEEFAAGRSLDDPCRLLARLAAMEAGLDAVHAGELSVTASGPLRRVFTALSLQDGVHRELLALAARRMRGEPDRAAPPATRIGAS